MYKTKVCRTCQKRKKINQFSLGRNKKPLLDCKTCVSAAAMERYYKHKNNNICTQCGTKHNHGTVYCAECAAKSVLRAKKWRQNRKKKCVEYLGGICNKCGLTTVFFNVYDFHHEDSEEKELQISHMIHRAHKWKDVKKELDKCVLLCANCHRIIHSHFE